ncbi:MAG: signal peptidase II [Ruminococcaceae bacterium]|nr:signal peptidase II [Oscillospiraceae bacterium]
MIWLLIGIIIGSVALDQLTKWLAVIYLSGEASFPLWKDVFHLTFVKNEGAAFGMLSDHRWVFMVFSSVAIIALAIYLFGFCKMSPWVKIPLAMIVGGGIGNMIDRVLLGYVIDFLDFTLINFAVFNVADCFVTVGAFLLIGYLLWDMIQEAKKEKAARSVPTEVDEQATHPEEDSHE